MKKPPQNSSCRNAPPQKEAPRLRLIPGGEGKSDVAKKETLANKKSPFVEMMEAYTDAIDREVQILLDL